MIHQLPRRYPVAGVLASATTYADATEHIVRAARDRRSLLVAATSVHGVTVAARDAHFRQELNTFDLITPDGQPIRWGLNLLHGAGLTDRVYGPTLMLRVCQAAAREGLSVYFYGSTPAVLERLAQRLASRLPGLRIAGFRSPPFRPSTAAEEAADAAAIRESGAHIVFVGLGCPRQERWAYRQRRALAMPIVCVGAAFDFHAGTLRQAPAWMQRRGLEWAFRLAMEPRRLWRRYGQAVPLYLFLLSRQYIATRLRGRSVPLA
ncbi:MAG: WecB/TagA/CpsF family glycosyltransferase [Chloroflexota bacterium]|nr:WecB/TagA/CpsF family glycosyltransferase [Chloroflexota bacterium]